jgi:ABC-type nitrate/sulfonate/bicarbonate transport system substrate-binding protein
MRTIGSRRLICLAFAFVVLVSTTLTSAYAEVREPLKLNVGFNIGSLNREVFLETGLRMGFFKKCGLEIEAKGYAVGGLIIQDLVGGHLDVGLAGISPSLAGVAQGGDIVIVSSQAKNDAPLVVQQSIKSLKDLDGKNVGTPGVSSIQETLLNYLEKKNGFKTKHVYGPPTKLINDMENREIDAIVAWEPVAAEAVAKLNAKYLLDTVVDGAEASMVTVSGKLLREHPDALKNLLVATNETKDYIKAHIDEVMQVAAEKTGIPADVIKDGVTRSQLYIAPLTINMESVRLIVESDISGGKLHNVDQAGIEKFLQKAIDESYLKKAVGETCSP